MGADYKLPQVLKARLMKLGLTQEQINENIESYGEEARVYIELKLEGYTLTEEQITLIKKNYIQYKLFADLEMESFVEDKRLFIERLIKDIKENKEELKEEKKSEAKGIMVF